MKTHRLSFVPRLSRFPVVALALVGLGCSMMKTTVSVRDTPGAPTQQIRLIRPDAAPLAAAWRQEGRELVGQLSFTAACQAEARQVTRREQVTETRPNKSYYVAAYVTGAILSVAGIALLAQSGTESEAVHCTTRRAESCGSTAEAYRTGGVTLLGSGLGAIVGGVIVQTRKPVIEASALPDRVSVAVDPKSYACGDLASLRDMTIAAELSNGGKRSGRVDANGGVRIALSSNADFGKRQSARFSVESAPATAPFAKPGLVLGELSLASPRKLASR